jgi:hypothetical protein
MNIAQSLSIKDKKENKLNDMKMNYYYTCKNNDCLRYITTSKPINVCPHCVQETLVKFDLKDINLEEDSIIWEKCFYTVEGK